MNNRYGCLRIMRYGALNGTWYRIAYYDGDFHFVFISKEKIAICKHGKTAQGKKYIQYEGPFELADDGTITIY